MSQMLIFSVKQDLDSLDPYNSDTTFILDRYMAHRKAIEAKMQQVITVVKETETDDVQSMQQIKHLMAIMG